MLLLTHDWSDPSAPWSEDHLQMAVVKTWRRSLAHQAGRFAFAAGMEGLAASSRATASRAVALGLTKGEPDLRVYWAPGRMGAIELKLADGTLTTSQKARHPVLRALGLPVVIVRAHTPASAVDQCNAVVAAWASLDATADFLAAGAG